MHMTAEDLADTGEQYNAILCREVIEHLPTVQTFAESMLRLLRIGGALLLTTPDAGHFRVPREFNAWK